ncbi:hypothetical protein Tco_1313627 [Tanacetum coccineum]
MIKRVYMLSLRERMELHLEARLIGETLVLNRSIDPLYGDYIDLNDLNVTLELRRDQVDDLMPIKEGELIEGVKARNDARMVSKIFGYPSDYDQYKIKFKGRNELGNWANVPIFIGNFCVLTSFVVVENMDPYVDEGMGELDLTEKKSTILVKYLQSGTLAQ